MRINRVLVLSASALVSGFFLQGCEKIVHSETKLSHSKLQVQEEAVFEDLRVDQVDAEYIAALSRHYNSKGDGEIDLSVTYDPRSKVSTAMSASGHVARISDEFRKNGITNVNGIVMPVNGHGDTSRVQVSYNAYSVSVPDDCTMIDGLEDRDIDPDEDYKLGCSRDALFAKQIARPKDLTGRGNAMETSDGRRAANIVDGYRTGAQNKPLDGESASE